MSLSFLSPIVILAHTRHPRIHSSSSHTLVILAYTRHPRASGDPVALGCPLDSPHYAGRMTTNVVSSFATSLF